jgi:hypothetical protein
MFKRKPARSGKARSSSKVRSKAARSGQHTNLIAMVSNWRSSAGSVENLDLVRNAGAGGTDLGASVKGNVTTLAHPHPVNRGV